MFIHPAAEDNAKIYQYNYEATKAAIANAMQGKPTAQDMIAKKTRRLTPSRVSTHSASMACDHAHRLSPLL
ncbi:MAG: formaldehyde-activating enzyme [Pirellulaceae bacterium]